jgi:nitrogen regulatory protein PII
MSHLVKTTIKVDSLKTLKKALDKMGLEYVEGKSAIKGWGSKSYNADLRLKNYEVGFTWNKELGQYEVNSDWYIVKGIKQSEFVKNLSNNIAMVKAEEACEDRNITIGTWEEIAPGQYQMVGTLWQ